MPDAIFEYSRLARLYDPLDPDRSDLDAYVAVIDEVDATSVLDVGCLPACGRCAPGYPDALIG